MTCRNKTPRNQSNAVAQVGSNVPPVIDIPPVPTAAEIMDNFLNIRETAVAALYVEYDKDVETAKHYYQIRRFENAQRTDHPGREESLQRTITQEEMALSALKQQLQTKLKEWYPLRVEKNLANQLKKNNQTVIKARNKELIAKVNLNSFTNLSEREIQQQIQTINQDFRVAQNELVKTVNKQLTKSRSYYNAQPDTEPKKEVAAFLDAIEQRLINLTKQRSELFSAETEQDILNLLNVCQQNLQNKKNDLLTSGKKGDYLGQSIYELATFQNDFGRGIWQIFSKIKHDEIFDLVIPVPTTLKTTTQRKFLSGVINAVKHRSAIFRNQCQESFAKNLVNKYNGFYYSEDIIQLINKTASLVTTEKNFRQACKDKAIPPRPEVNRGGEEDDEDW